MRRQAYPFAASGQGNHWKIPRYLSCAIEHGSGGSMSNETPVIVRHDSLVLVGDGRKALFLRNKGDAGRIQLVVEDIFERDNPPTREQGSDRPGRSVASVGTARSAMEEVDWH